MSESESEDEILDRIEAALRKIAGASPRPEGGEALDRAALTEKLDSVIARLREGLEGAPQRETPEPPRESPEAAPMRNEMDEPRPEPPEPGE